jgi:hypothetical protein
MDMRLRALICGLLGAIVLSACSTPQATSTLQATSVDKKIHPAAVDSNIVQTLQRQIRERDKRIAELESQLDDLKAIDEDMQKRRPPY